MDMEFLSPLFTKHTSLLSRLNVESQRDTMILRDSYFSVSHSHSHTHKLLSDKNFTNIKALYDVKVVKFY